jgi:glutathione S-transferase
MDEVEIIGHVGNYSRAVRMACEEKNIPYKVTTAVPHSPAALKLHPFGKIPILRHGNFVLCESKAIVSYLDRISPETPLIPNEPLAQALTEQWISMVNDVVDQTMIREYALSYLLPTRAGRPPERAIIDAAVPKLERQLGVLDEAVSQTGFLVGSQLTFADINLMPILSSIQAYDEGRAAFEARPRLRDYFQRHAQRASFRNTAVVPN